MARPYHDYCPPPLPPVKADIPIDEYQREWLLDAGHIDEHGKLTPLGIAEGWTQEEIDGCETDEQFAARMREYRQSMREYRREYKQETGEECPWGADCEEDDT